MLASEVRQAGNRAYSQDWLPHEGRHALRFRRLSRQVPSELNTVQVKTASHCPEPALSIAAATAAGSVKSPFKISIINRRVATVLNLSL
jgi:hypothetical protein